MLVYGRHDVSRRFYQAFYRWQRLQSSGICQRCFSAVSYHANSPDHLLAHSNREAPVRRHIARANPKYDRSVEANTRPVKIDDPIFAPITPVSERPFDTLHPWEDAVRYRSEAGLLLEIAVPALTLRRIQAAFWQDLGLVQDETGARCELGSTAVLDGLESTSVTLSGTFYEVQRSRNMITSFKPAEWLRDTPIPQSSKSTQSLQPWAWILRESEGEYRKIEMIVPTDTWVEIRSKPQGRDLGPASGVDIELLEEHEVVTGGPALLMHVQPITIAGRYENVYEAFLAILNKGRFFEAKTKHAANRTQPGAEAGVAQSPVYWHYIVLEIPLGPNGEDGVRRLAHGSWGNGLAFLNHRFGVANQILNGTPSKLKILAPTEESIRKAKRHIQSVVSTACGREGIPSMQVRKVEAGMTDVSVQAGRLSAGAVPSEEGGGNLEAAMRRESVRVPTNTKATKSSVITSPTDLTPTATSLNFSTLLRIPNGPNGEPEALRIFVGPDGAGLTRLYHDFSVKAEILEARQDLLVLHGNSKEDLRRAREFVQGAVGQANEEAGLPRGVVEEVEDGNGVGVGSSSFGMGTLGKMASGSGQKFDEPRGVNLDDLKIGLRPLTHPVVLITSRVLDEEPTDGKDDALLRLCRGITVSSFSAITLQPTPMVTFNIRTPSRTWDAISSSGWLVAHILAASPTAAALAHAFTLPHERPEEPFQRARRMGAAVWVDAIAKQARDLVPHIRLFGATLCTMTSKVHFDKCLQVGDHMVVVAEVKRLKFPYAAKNSRSEVGNANGLAYAQQAYRSVGRQLEVAQSPDVSPSVATPTAEQAGTAPNEGLEGVSQVMKEDEHAHYDVGAPIDDTHLPTLDATPSQSKTPQRTDIDYSEAADSGDFGLGPVDDDPLSAQSGQEPLVEDSAAAQEVMRSQESEAGDRSPGEDEDTAKKRALEATTP